MIKPFIASTPQHTLDDLKHRLSQTRWPDELDSTSWESGASLSYIKELCHYWETEFDWREIEQQINSYPNFLADIEGHQVHFIHVKGKGKQNVPLLLTHGWPGSFLEFMKIIPLLTGDKDFSFDLVIPSVLGFGFSEPAKQSGCDNAYIANIWKELMAG